MTAQGFLQITIYVVTLLLLAKPLGSYMARVYDGKFRALEGISQLIYRLCGINSTEEMSWKHYLCTWRYRLAK